MGAGCAARVPEVFPVMKNSPLRPSLKPLERRTPLAPGTPRKRWRPPPALRRRVYRRSGGCCVMCLAKIGLSLERAHPALARGVFVRACAQIHHVLPVQHFPDLERCEANMVGVCAACHDEHERAIRRIPRSALPALVVARALAHEGGAVYMDRVYPAESEAA
jgi:5-methylcytosine-specific restriction endonuclease McrA